MNTNKSLLLILILFSTAPLLAQLRWQQVDSLFGELPNSVSVYRSHDSLDGQPGIAYYVKVDLNDPRLVISVDSSMGRRLTKAGDLILKPTREHMEANLIQVFQNKVKILISHLRESDAAILGASALAWEK